MPPSAEVKPGNPNANYPPSQKGKPLGIPKWGWIAGIALGLVIGYLVLKNKNSSSSTSGNDTGTGSSPLGNSDSGSGGGAVATPPPAQLSAQGITNNGSADPSAVAGTGDSSTSTNPQTLPGGQAVTVAQIVAAGIPAQSPQNEAPIGGSGTQTVSSQSGNVTTISKPAGSNVNRPGLQM